MAEFERFKLVLPLEAQMPMIHFQSTQCGATLRASEVKPKLDRFLIGKMMKEAGKDLSGLKKDGNYKGLFLDAGSEGNDGLDYKLQITERDVVREVDLSKNEDKKENYTMFYANMGKHDPAELVYGVFSSPLITIICFKEKLRHYIEENIEKFFLVTNFGTMQNKGFGSFVPAAWCTGEALDETKMAEVAAAYQELIPGGVCYAMEFRNYPGRTAPFAEKNRFCKEMSETIKNFYSIMKSGQNMRGYVRSYIYTYGHDVLKLGNEKAWMKKNRIAPIVSQPQNEKKHEYGSEKYRYLRAFLGIGEQIEYGTGYKIGTNGKEVLTKEPMIKVSIKCKSAKIERLASPVYFKVIGNVVFIVAFDVPEELYGAEFMFASEKKWKNKKIPAVAIGSGTITVPDKAELNGTFDIQDFLKRYVEFYNGEMRNELTFLNRAPKVKVVKPNA
ncbi:MAG: hypothetical protein J6J42_07490 [Lachnospiraceae bacterium]|nr:hypothetical protein [Lachnospiraceae bacterium]